MSSTNRGGQRSEADYYPTPPWPVHRLLERSRLPGGLWVEPGAGDGSIIRAVNERRRDVRWIAAELRPECEVQLLEIPRVERVLIGNFRAADLGWLGLQKRADVCFGNPPFRHAMEFVLRGFEIARWVVLLLRLNFLGTADRNDFMRRHAPDHYVIPDRIPFLGGNETDSVEHAWFVWPPNRRRTRGTYEVLSTTPANDRMVAEIETVSIGEQLKLLGSVAA